MKQKRGCRALALAVALALTLGTTALAAGINGSNPAGTYRATEFYDLDYHSVRIEPIESGYGFQSYYTSDSGTHWSPSGEALLIDTPLEKSFSASLAVDYLEPPVGDASEDRSDELRPASTFQVEMTRLERIIKNQGEWLGRFNVTRDGVPVFTNAPGRLEHVPSLDGTQAAVLTIGDEHHVFRVSLNFGLRGFQIVEGTAAAYSDTRNLQLQPDTVKITTRLATGAQVDGYTAIPYFHDEIYFNPASGQCACEILLMPEGLDDVYLSLTLRPQDVTSADRDRVTGIFFLKMPNNKDREVAGTLRNLSGETGEMIQFRAADGSLSLDFMIEDSIRVADRVAEYIAKHEQEFSNLSEEDAELLAALAGQRLTPTPSYQYLDLINQIGTADLQTFPFTIAAAGDTIFIRYNGDPKYQVGAKLVCTVLDRENPMGEPFTEEQAMEIDTVYFQIPENAIYVYVYLTQEFGVSKGDGYDSFHYNMSFRPGEDGALVTEFWYTHEYDSRTR